MSPKKLLPSLKNVRRHGGAVKVLTEEFKKRVFNTFGIT